MPILDQSNLINGVAIGSLDAKLLIALEETWNPDSVLGRRIRVGIRNDDGVIYRVIGFQTLQDFTRFFERAINAGFTSEVPQADPGPDGFTMVMRIRKG